MFELLLSTKRSPSQGWPSLGNFTGEQRENHMETGFRCQLSVESIHFSPCWIYSLCHQNVVWGIPRDWWPSPSKVFLNGFPVITRGFRISMLEFSLIWMVAPPFLGNPISHRIHGAGIYANMYHQYTPNVSIYTSTMDPMAIWELRQCFYRGNHPSFIPSQPTITHQPQPLRTSNSCAVRASQTKRWPQSEPLGEWKRWQMWKKMWTTGDWTIKTGCFSNKNIGFNHDLTMI